MTKLREWVVARDVAVAITAADLGVGRVALHKYMSGAAMPRPGVVQRITALSGVTASDLQADYRGAPKRSGGA